MMDELRNISESFKDYESPEDLITDINKILESFKSI